MKDFIKKIISSLDNHTKGFSARKLSAITVMVLVIIAHYKWLSIGDLTLLGEVLIIDYGFIAMCLGMTTYEAIKAKTNSPDSVVK
jgi:hypothetical protein